MVCPHPEKDELLAFAQGRLGPDGINGIEQHLQGCQACCDTLLSLGDDTFAADESGTLLRWKDDTREWQPLTQQRRDSARQQRGHIDGLEPDVAEQRRLRQ